MSIIDYGEKPSSTGYTGLIVTTNFKARTGQVERTFFAQVFREDAFALEAKWQAWRLEKSPSLTEVSGLYIAYVADRNRPSLHPYNVATINMHVARSENRAKAVQSGRRCTANKSISRAWNEMTLKLATVLEIQRPAWWLEVCPKLERFHQLRDHYERTGRMVDKQTVKSLWMGDSL